MSKKATGKNISMYPQDWQIVKQVADGIGVNTSLAVRLIIRDWQRLKANRKSALALEGQPSSATTPPPAAPAINIVQRP